MMMNNVIHWRRIRRSTVELFGLLATLAFTNVEVMADGAAVFSITQGGPLIITAQPASQQVAEGETAQFAVSVTGVEPIYFQWQKNGTNLVEDARIKGVTNIFLLISDVQAEDAGAYSVLVWNVVMTKQSQTAVLTVTPQSIAHALGTEGFIEWTTGGDQPWFVEKTNTFDSPAAVQSGAIQDGQQSWIEAVFTPPTLGIFRFQWQVSSEDHNDWLTFSVNGAEVDRISGTTNWAPRGLEILTTNQQTLRWTYMKNGSLASGLDAGWLDAISFEARPPTVPIITQEPQDQEASPGANIAFMLTATGFPSPTYQWYFNGAVLAGATNTTLALSNVQSQQAGKYYAVASNLVGMVTSRVATFELSAGPPIKQVGEWPGFTRGNARAVAVVGHYAYVAAEAGGLMILDIIDPAHPKALSGYDTSGQAGSVQVVGNYAYVADYALGLQVIDVSDPVNPRRVAAYGSSGNAVAVEVAGNHAYVAYGPEGLEVLDVSDPLHPRRVGGYVTRGEASGVQVVGDYAYVADGQRLSGTNLVGSFQIVDVSDPANPRGVGECDTSGYARDVQVVGNYAYVADGPAGLLVIDISEPANPQPKGRYAMSSPAYSVQGVGNMVYVADYDAGLQVIDVSDATNPQRVGGYDTRGYAWGVQVVDKYAYVADYNAGLQVIDVSEPANPRLVGGYDTSGGALGVQVAGNYAYLADYDAGLQVIDVSDPANPLRVGGFHASGYDLSVQVVGNYAYVANDGNGLQIIDVSNPSNPQQVGGYATSGRALDVQVAGNYAYVAERETGFEVIDVSDPANPRRVGGYDASGAVSHMQVVGNYAYVVAGGLQVVDVSNPANPQRVGAYSDTDGQFLSVQVAGNYAYAGVVGKGLQVIDVSNPASPRWVGGSVTSQDVLGLEVVTNNAYAVCGEAGLQVIDVSNPANPRRTGEFDTGGQASAIHVVGNYAYIADGSRGLAVLQLTFPHQPVAPIIDRSSIQMSAQGFQWNFSTEPTVEYSIEVSEDLTIWREVEVLTATGGVMDYLDSTVSGAPRRFYRVKRVP